MEIVFFFTLGTIIFTFGFYYLIIDYRALRNGFHTQGIVVDVLEDVTFQGGREIHKYFPIVKFKNQENEELEVLLETLMRNNFYDKNEKLKVIYYQGNLYPNSLGWRLLNWGIMSLGLGLAGFQLL